jgi:hypothetical protein
MTMFSTAEGPYRGIARVHAAAAPRAPTPPPAPPPAPPSDGDGGGDHKRGSTDETGHFVIFGVDNGKHRLVARSGDSYQGSAQFTLPRGAVDRHLDPLELRPPLNLGYTILALQTTEVANVVRYDLVLWVHGAPAALRRVRQVSYRLPVPLPDNPIPAGPPSRSYCFRQQGTLTYDDVAGDPKLEAATAMIRLDDGAGYSIPAAPEAATTYRASSRSGSATGAVRDGAADISLPMRCTGASDTFTFTVADADGQVSDPYRIAVNTGLPKRTVTPSAPG